MHNGDDDRGDEKAEECKACEGAVGKREESARKEDGEQGGNDGETGSANTNTVEDKGSIKRHVQLVKAILNLFWPLEVGEVQFESAICEFLLQKSSKVKVGYIRESACESYQKVNGTHTHGNISGAARVILVCTSCGGIWREVSRTPSLNMETVPLVDTKLVRDAICDIIPDTIQNVDSIIGSIIDRIVEKIRKDSIVRDWTVLVSQVGDQVVAKSGCVELGTN